PHPPHRHAGRPTGGARRDRVGDGDGRAADGRGRAWTVYSSSSARAPRRGRSRVRPLRRPAGRDRPGGAVTRDEQPGGTLIHLIRYYGDPVLRRRASEVTEFDADLKRLAADMIETMYAADGVGLAAPQTGVSKRLFVALEVQSGADDDPDAEEGEVAAAERRRRWEERREHVIVNPRLVKREGQQF